MQAPPAMNSFRAGMQVHAVPDDERATDVNGKPLPWAYSYADSSLNRKQPVERGPFGRPISRRASSRTKTATPGPREDPIVAENMKTFDEIFGRHRQAVEEKEVKAPREQRQPATISRIPHAQSAMDLMQSPPAQAQVGQEALYKEPTPVMIYGFGSDQQGVAIAAFEALSGGHIYEDYDRDTNTSRYNQLFANNVRASIPRSLAKEAIRNINTYRGGEHWIKVTFDSPGAADLAIFSVPHLINGYDVYAEPWRGLGREPDVAIPTGTSTDNAPTQRRSTQPQSRRPFSSMPARIQSAPAFAPLEPHDEGTPESIDTASTGTANGHATGNDVQSSQQLVHRGPAADEVQKPLRVRGATRMAMRPASEALLPVAPWSQRTFGHIPLLGSLFGGDPNTKPGQGGGIIGNSVPRKDDGAFDWTTASTYWKLCWYLDQYTFTDLCGMKGDD